MVVVTNSTYDLMRRLNEIRPALIGLLNDAFSNKAISKLPHKRTPISREQAC